MELKKRKIAPKWGQKAVNNFTVLDRLFEAWHEITTTRAVGRQVYAGHGEVAQRPGGLGVDAGRAEKDASSFSRYHRALTVQVC